MPDITRRLAQELVVNDKVNVLAGFGITPLGAGRRADRHPVQDAEVVMAAATSIITEASPFIVRTSFTLPQASVALGDWAPKNGIKTVVTLVSDYGPGIDAEKSFKERFQFNGGKVIDPLRVPLRNPDFAPFLQKVRDAKPDALFVFVPSGAGAAVMKQFVERGMDKAGIKLIGTGDVTDDDQLNEMGDVRARRGHLAPLFGRHNVAGQQEVRRGLREGQQGHAARTSWPWAATTACASSTRR